jgi:hypothetical protein
VNKLALQLGKKCLDIGYHLKVRQFVNGQSHGYWQFTDKRPEDLCDTCEQVTEVIELDLDVIEIDDAQDWIEALSSLNAVSKHDDVFAVLAGIFRQGYEAGRKSLARQITKEAA